MNPLAFMTHPSIRIKGAENNYTPTICSDPECSTKIPHMHCPFCVKTDFYQDPVILKAHYRVKHVDKGIEFAALKILRCCDHCDIVGIIKGEKKFKGAHWHCYKCRNGFNRRDEALKHYRTHFRNPQTTFQIQIAQDVTQSVTDDVENHDATTNIQDEGVIHPVLTEAACLASPDQVCGEESEYSDKVMSDGGFQVSIAANETINTADGQTIMIISEEHLETARLDSPLDVHIVTQSKHSSGEEEKDDKICGKKYEVLEDHCSKLEKDNAALLAEVERLKLQSQILCAEINSYKKRESELLQQLSANSSVNLQSLISELETQHRELIQAQLGQLRTAYITQLAHGGPQSTKVLQVGFSANTEIQPEQGVTILKEEDLTHNEVESAGERNVVDNGNAGNYSGSGITEEEMVVSTSSQDDQINVSMVMASPLVMCVEEGSNCSPSIKHEQVDLDQDSDLNRSGVGTSGQLSENNPLSSEPKAKRKCKR
ncbi:uncharacterized protein LOC121367358 [Gigantopelta aegis]|uniref:uncharacterized protein LOC121367358 n=1 Tax=Gigantopelta aegis TaxID=1735272 RepID=UPI001B88A3A7|nr:uncharacterized protein LOC121367358 [Gigantopelta aegis]